jgi:protein-L-isoaspartate(D-aspartate) O-methyltransferase
VKPLTEQHLAVFRRHMVELIDIEFDLLSEEIGRDRLRARIRDAFLKVPRHLFVPPQLAALAYHNQPLPIGFDKTISQPFIAALMIELLDLSPDDRVLEVGTGHGYQAAILAELVTEVRSVEIVEEFVPLANANIQLMGHGNVEIRIGDGSRGWSEEAPFDAVLVTAAAKQPPPTLIEQLKPGGRMVIPLSDDGVQQLTRIEKGDDDEVVIRRIMPVKFTELETVF